VTGPEGTRHAELTIKGKGLVSRAEFNYPSPTRTPRRCSDVRPQPAQVRRKIGRFELDHFRERDLWLAEIELADERERFQRRPGSETR